MLIVSLPKLLLNIAASDLIDFPERRWLYQRLGIQGGEFYASSGCYFVYPNLSNVTLGNKVFLNHGCYLDNGAAITIGDNACLGPFVRILTTTHAIGEAERRVGHGCVKRPVTIGAGAWIGAGVTILPGVTVGAGCVIGAGAVVTRDCEPDTMYLGVPGKPYKVLKSVCC